MATLEGALDGNLEMTINSGHFTGWTGATHFIATPTIGDCYSAPITGESAIIEQISLAPPTLGAI